MPYAQNKDVRVNFKEIGTGPPLVLQHGMTGNMGVWSRHGYVEPLSKKYRLILVDARGHGSSDKPHKPEDYRISCMVGDVTSVLDELGVEKAHFFGYSMGGRIGLSAAKYAPDRLSSLVIGGNGMKERDDPEQIIELKAYSKLFQMDVETVISSMEKKRGSRMDEWERQKWLNNDLKALDAYCNLYENIGMKEYLPNVTIPTLLFAGSDDTYPHQASKQCAELMQNAQFVSLPGLNHAGTIRERITVLPHVFRFLESVS